MFNVTTSEAPRDLIFNKQSCTLVDGWIKETFEGQDEILPSQIKGIINKLLFSNYKVRYFKAQILQIDQYINLHLFYLFA